MNFLPAEDCARVYSYLGLERACRACMVGFGAGVGFNRGPTLRDLVVQHDGFHFDAANGLALNTQPTLGNWTGTSWSGTGLGPYAHAAGTAHTTDLAQALDIVGNRYLTAYAVSNTTAGTVTHKDGSASGSARSANGAYSDELICAGNTSHIFTPTATFDGSVTVGSVTNLSVASWAPVALGPSWTGFTLANATAANMPWRSTSTVNGLQALQQDSTDSVIGSFTAASYNGFHAGSATMWVVLQASSLASTPVLLSTFSGTASLRGVYLDCSASGKLHCMIGNGSSSLLANHVSADGAIGTVRPHVVVWRHTAGLSSDLWVDGAYTTAGLVGAESAGAAATALRVFGYSEGLYGLTGYALATGACLAALSTQQIAFLGRRLAQRWGGVWP